MISNKDIQISEFPWQEHDTILRGRLQLGADVVLTQHELRARIGAKESAKERVRRAIWRKVYGDLVKPIRELQRFATHSAQYHEIERVQEIIEEIEKLLEGKKE